MNELPVLGAHIHDGVPLAVAARSAGVPVRTAFRWLAAYQADGAAGLTRSGRPDRGGRRMPPEMLELIEGLALRRPSALEIVSTAKAAALLGVCTHTLYRWRRTGRGPVVAYQWPDGFAYLVSDLKAWQAQRHPRLIPLRSAV